MNIMPLHVVGTLKLVTLQADLGKGMFIDSVIQLHFLGTKCFAILYIV